jgi:hypothetical protein
MMSANDLDAGESFQHPRIVVSFPQVWGESQCLVPSAGTSPL